MLKGYVWINLDANKQVELPTLIGKAVDLPILHFNGLDYIGCKRGIYIGTNAHNITW